jgi:large subunit ribosomal protein L25
VVRHDVELSCPADAIPEELVFDLAGLDIGDTIRISNFTLPKGVEPTVDRDFVIATVAGTSAQAAADAAAEGDEAASDEA